MQPAKRAVILIAHTHRGMRISAYGKRDTKPVYMSL